VGKGKLGKFAEMNTFKNVIQPPFKEIFGKDFRLKTKWHNYFGNDNPIVLELGCGKGEYTTGLAKAYPGKNFIGIDIKGSRMWTGAKYALMNNMKNVVFLRTRIEFTRSFFGKDEIQEIWLTFPDPQPKRKKVKKRLMAANFLNLYRTFLVENGLIHLKTDNAVLYKYARSMAVYNSLEQVEATDDLYGQPVVPELLNIKTFYEKNYLCENRKIHYLVFRLQNKFIRELPDEIDDIHDTTAQGSQTERIGNIA
jgi:tRNA (guanine-N7-)-methyltransferase